MKDMMSAKNAKPMGISLLVDWAKEQDYWIQAFVAEIIDLRKPLSEDRIDYFYNMLLREKELAEGNIVKKVVLKATAEAGIEESSLVLKSLRDVENVNALTPNQNIEFNSHVTVLFGENASGKTGYVRVLKQVASARNAEPILPDVRTGKSPNGPRAIIEYSHGDKNEIIKWLGEKGVDPLHWIDIFDARAEVVHLDENLTYTYTPADLALFPMVHEGIEKTCEKLEKVKDEKKPTGNPYLSKFSRGSPIYTKIESLGSSTNLPEFVELSKITPEEEAGLPGLREKVSALRTGGVQGKLQGVLNERALYKRVDAVEAAVKAFNYDDYLRVLEKVHKAEEGHKQGTKDAFIGYDITGILKEAWCNFIEAGEAYLQDSDQTNYPEKDGSCIYCHQPLNDSAIALIKKYRAYCNDLLRKAVEEAKAEYRIIIKNIDELEMEQLFADLKMNSEAIEKPSEIPVVLSKAQELLKESINLQNAVREGKKYESSSFGMNLQEYEPVLRAHLVELGQAITDLQKQLKEREQILASESARLLELEDRIVLREILPQVRIQVEAACWVDKAQTQLARFRGVKRSLTDISKVASEAMLNQNFERLFEIECRDLRAPKVMLEFPGRRGEPARRKTLTHEHGLVEILSEGEQKVVALADFFAELSLKSNYAPIVLDDPVSSLDHKRLQHVVDRLVNLSQNRQVIVFTHDIWFAAEILARFEKNRSNCTFYDVLQEDDRIGIIARGSSPRTDTFNDRKKRINIQIEEAKKSSGEGRQALIEKGYEELRGACEIVVEQDLLKGVTERYRPNVRMTVLDQIRPDRLKVAIQSIVPLFERCCRIITSHSQPMQQLGVRPTLAELEEDWKILQETRKEYLNE